MSQEVSKIVSIWFFHPLVKRFYFLFQENLNHHHLSEPTKGTVQVSEHHSLGILAQRT